MCMSLKACGPNCDTCAATGQCTEDNCVSGYTSDTKITCPGNDDQAFKLKKPVSSFAIEQRLPSLILSIVDIRVVVVFQRFEINCDLDLLNGLLCGSIIFIF